MAVIGRSPAGDNACQTGRTGAGLGGVGGFADAGKTLVEATQAARDLAQTKREFTWLAYTVYGNPFGARCSVGVSWAPCRPYATRPCVILAWPVSDSPDTGKANRRGSGDSWKAFARSPR